MFTCREGKSETSTYLESIWVTVGVEYRSYQWSAFLLNLLPFIEGGKSWWDAFMCKGISNLFIAKQCSIRTAADSEG